MTDKFELILEEASKRGHEVKARDIAYALIREWGGNSKVAYAVAWGNPNFADKDVARYEKQQHIKWLRHYIKDDLNVEKNTSTEKEQLPIGKKKKAKDGADITFEQNKAEMIKLLDENEKAHQEGKIAVKDYLKISSDIRCRLNDKFGAAEKTSEQYIIVQPKYNKICPHTGHECYEMTKEYAKEFFNLVEKEEIEDERENESDNQ